ncbi:MAG: hypothetical protein ABR564_05950 [Candidatus Dormibacteria bacterium]
MGGDALLHGLEIATGLIVVMATVGSVMRTLIVPRGLIRRIPVGLDNTVRRLVRFTADRFPSYESKDRLLSYEGPVRLVAGLGGWLLAAMAGYTLIFRPAVGSWAEALAHSGSAMFTLGFVSVQGTAPIAISFFAAATGAILIALQISYLPTLYGAFNRRETLVTMLSSRAGAPPWGPELLARQQLIGNLDDLERFYGDWETWAADVAESHANYPVLLAFRSPHPMRSWLIALLAVLDSAALYLAVAPRAAPPVARVTLRMGYTCLREIATVLRIPFNDDPLPEDPVVLTLDEFRAGVATLESVDFPLERNADDVWQDFRGWRVNYEGLVLELANRLAAPPALWSGERRRLAGLQFAPERPPHRHPIDPLVHPHGPH